MPATLRFGLRSPGRACGRGTIHSSHLLELSQDLPLVIEVVDSEEHVARLMPILDEMMNDGLVTVEKVRVLRYAAGVPRS